MNHNLPPLPQLPIVSEGFAEQAEYLGAYLRRDAQALARNNQPSPLFEMCAQITRDHAKLVYGIDLLPNRGVSFENTGIAPLSEDEVMAKFPRKESKSGTYVNGWHIETRLRQLEDVRRDLKDLKSGEMTLDDLILCADENIEYCKVQIRKARAEVSTAAEDMTAADLREGR